uniref:Uncharacterized protein n=1 Tax=Zea mays TaxID=4577 RepID=C0PP74_MAIZE|nr:unknown [Zea mays]|eukprot:XP_020404939.1 uncharacterized protein LOC100384429 [Zea mays]
MAVRSHIYIYITVTKSTAAAKHAGSRGGEFVRTCLDTPLDDGRPPRPPPCGTAARKALRGRPRGEQSHLIILMCSQFAPAGTALHRACCRRRSSSRHGLAG